MIKSTLKKQTFNLVTGNLATTLGSTMFEFGVGLYLLKLTGSSAIYSFVLIIGPVVMLALLPFSGAIIDRFDHAKIIRFSQFFNIGALLSFSLLDQFLPQFFLFEIFILVTVLRITALFTSSTLQASLNKLVTDNALHRVNSLNQTSASIANILSPVLGAIFFSILPFEGFSLMMLITEILTLICFLRLDFAFVPAKTTYLKRETSLFQDFKAGLAYVLRTRLPQATTLSNVTTNFFIASINVGMAFTEVTFLHMTNAEFGLTEMAFGVGMLLSGLYLSIRPQFIFPARASWLATVVLGLSLILFGLPQWLQTSHLTNVILFSIYNLAAGILVVIKNTPILSLLQQQIPNHLQGRVFTLQTTLGAILSPVGSIFYGILFGLLTPAPIYLVTGLLLAGLTLLIWWRYRDVAAIKKS
ncbi:MAG TPA: MFS transporter [Lactobacillaceae bacterium]|jgi:MFS family permease